GAEADPGVDGLQYIAGAGAGQGGLVDPTLGAVLIADFAPDIEFLDDFDGHAADQVFPGDIILVARPDADRRILGPDGDEAGERQAARIGGSGQSQLGSQGEA